jgi:uncharacterized protein (TIGR02118 family)
MIKLVVMYPWPADPYRFKRHFLGRHLPLCRAIPGILRSHYAFEPKTVEGSGKWFCIYEAEFVDLATPEAERAAADVANYSPDLPTFLVNTSEPA